LKTRKDIQELRHTKAIILFDGLCNFCDQSVQFVIKRDFKNQFLYASLQSDTGTNFLKTQSETIQNSDSIILVTGSKVYSKSTAAIKIAIKLKGLWVLLIIFYIFPPFIRDAVYDYIAKNRYRWFGKFDSCKTPTPNEKDKFLD
jgi:predicted DCC family thiol-disulfide oxidoreductase YuxK